MNETTQSVTLTEKELRILQHALDKDKYGHGRHARNLFVTDDDCENGVICNRLVTWGLMLRHPPRELSGGSPWFTVTQDGQCAMRANSPNPAKQSASQRRYLEWLRLDSCESFGDWLKRTAKEQGPQ